MYSKKVRLSLYKGEKNKNQKTHPKKVRKDYKNKPFLLKLTFSSVNLKISPCGGREIKKVRFYTRFFYVFLLKT